MDAPAVTQTIRRRSAPAARPSSAATTLRRRLFGPLLDRIDIPYGVVSRHIEVPRVPFQKLSDPRSATYAARGRCDRRGEPSAAIRARVEAARARHTARFASVGRSVGRGLAPTTNADTLAPALSRDPGARCGPRDPGRSGASAGVGPTEVRDHCAVDEAGRQLLGTVMRHTCPGGQCQGMHLSARAYHRILKLARTIADLAGAERTPALAAAPQRRCKCPAGPWAVRSLPVGDRLGDPPATGREGRSNALYVAHPVRAMSLFVHLHKCIF
jgi:predicted ATPase with chaperone activity